MEQLQPNQITQSLVGNRETAGLEKLKRTGSIAPSMLSAPVENVMLILSERITLEQSNFISEERLRKIAQDLLIGTTRLPMLLVDYPEVIGK